MINEKLNNGLKEKSIDSYTPFSQWGIKYSFIDRLLIPTALRTSVNIKISNYIPNKWARLKFLIIK